MEQISKYELEAWIERLQSMPVEVVIADDKSFSYEMTKFTILRLENGKFATINENGCSCYEARDAEIEILPSIDTAKEQYNKWVKLMNERTEY